MTNPIIIANQAQLDEELEKLGDEGFHRQPQMVVNTIAHIDARKLKKLCGKDNKRLSLVNCVFNDMVNINNFSGEEIIHIERCHFLRGLWIEACDLKLLSIGETKMKSLRLSRVKTKSIGLGDLSIENALEIDGLDFDSERPLNLIGVEYDSLVTYSPQTSGTANIRSVVTDDPVTATQFRLMGVPVYMSTKAIRQNQGTLMESATA